MKVHVCNLREGRACSEVPESRRCSNCPVWVAPKAVESEQARDAGRYRWLRDKAMEATGTTVWCVIGSHGDNTRPTHGDTLDKALDAAMSASGAPAAAPAGKALRWLTREELESYLGLGNKLTENEFMACKFAMEKFVERNGLPTPAGEGERS